MNALARIIRDLTSGREPSQADLSGLSPQELTTLRELEAGAALTPRGAARMLAAAEPMQDWWKAPKAATQVTG